MTKELISKSDYIISIGAFITLDKKDINDCLMQAISKNNAEFIYMHPIDCASLKMFYTQFVKYEVGSEEGIISLLAQAFIKNSNDNVQAYLDDLDLGYISAESSAGEEEFEEAYERSENKKNKILLIGNDILAHDRVENIIKLLSLINKYTDLTCICLDSFLQEQIDACDDENLEEIEDIKSYNGTVLYRYEDKNSSDVLLGSESFARIAKIADNDEIILNTGSLEINVKFKLDKSLQGAIGLLACNDKEVFASYKYKQIKVQKV